MRRRSPVLRPTWSVGVVLLSLGALLGAGMPAFAQAPPETTIPRVPNPPLNSDLANLPGDLRAVAVPGSVEPGRLRQGSRHGARPRQGALLGHAGRERRRAGLRELPLPRRRRSALEEPGEPGLEACARGGPHLLDRPGPNHQLEAVGLPADPARQPGRPRRARSGHRQQRRRVFAGHPSSRC